MPSHWEENAATQYYSNNGELLYVRKGKLNKNDAPMAHDRYVVASRDGQVLFTKTNFDLHDYYYANGNTLGNAGALNMNHLNEREFSMDFDNNYTPVSDMQYASSPLYRVEKGDTLPSIAQKVWGDSSLWFYLADANALPGMDAELTFGQQLTVPTINSNVHNNSTTFKPYDASEIIGSTEAEPTYAPPSRSCGQMVVALVTVVVAVVVAAVITINSGGANAPLGAQLIAGAVGAMAGNGAGQLTAQALDLQSGFDMSSLGKSFFIGLATAGVGAVAGAAGQAVGGTWAGQVGAIATKSLVMASGNYLVNRAFNDQSFSWKALAASTAAQMASYGISENIPALQENEFMKTFTSSFAGGYVDNRVRAWTHIGGQREMSSIITDAFGNAIGASAVAAITPRSNSIAEYYDAVGHRDASNRIEQHYRQEGMIGRGKKHYNDVIKGYGVLGEYDDGYISVGITAGSGDIVGALRAGVTVGPRGAENRISTSSKVTTSVDKGRNIRGENATKNIKDIIARNKRVNKSADVGISLGGWGDNEQISFDLLAEGSNLLVGKKQLGGNYSASLKERQVNADAKAMLGISYAEGEYLKGNEDVTVKVDGRMIAAAGASGALDFEDFKNPTLQVDAGVEVVAVQAHMEFSYKESYEYVDVSLGNTTDLNLGAVGAKGQAGFSRQGGKVQVKAGIGLSAIIGANISTSISLDFKVDAIKAKAQGVYNSVKEWWDE